MEHTGAVLELTILILEPTGAVLEPGRPEAFEAQGQGLPIRPKAFEVQGFPRRPQVFVAQGPGPRGPRLAEKGQVLLDGFSPIAAEFKLIYPSSAIAYFVGSVARPLRH